MTRKEKFEAVYKRYEQEAAEAKEHAMRAKADHRKSDYDFWKQAFDIAREREMHFFNEMISCKD